jgi:ribonuclease BN (tRNA processing enzyme)
MLLTFLGTAGWMPSSGKETSAFLVRSFDDALLLDAGTGISRLVTEPSLLEGISRIDILLSHFHLDHVIGLSYLNALKGVEIGVWGPGALLYGVSSHDVLRRLLSPPLLEFDMTDRIAAVQDVPGGTFQVNEFKVEARHQPTHTSPSLAYRVNDDLVYCTDTEYDSGNIEFAQGAQLLLHEAWTVAKPVQGHSTAA